MKIIVALKQVKANRQKILDLIEKIKANSARTTAQTSPYGEQKEATAQVTSWMDAVRSIIRENEKLVNRIHRTNVSTLVKIEIGGNVIEKTIDEWIQRRKEGVSFEGSIYRSLTDRGLREELVKNPDGTTTHVTIVRHFDPKDRDERLSVVTEELSIIDSTLEIINATTDLVD